MLTSAHAGHGIVNALRHIFLTTIVRIRRETRRVQVNEVDLYQYKALSGDVDKQSTVTPPILYTEL